jgi:hypothetical protein
VTKRDEDLRRIAHDCLQERDDLARQVSEDGDENG